MINKKRFISIISFASLIGFLSCGSDGRLEAVKLNGLNGEAYYYYNPRNRELRRVVKVDYMLKTDYSIGVNKDTLILGEDFVCDIGVFRGNYKIVIEEPRKEVIEGSYIEPEPGSPHEMKIYKHRVDRQGLYSMKGRIEIDTLIIPFEYKFLVVQN